VDLLDHLLVARTYWWKILLVALVAGGLSYGFSVSHPKEYAADQLLSVGIQSPLNAFRPGETQIDLRARFYAAIGNARSTAETVRSKQHLTSLSVEQVKSKIDVLLTPTIGILEVSTTGRSQLEAAEIAGGVSNALSDYVTAEQTVKTNAERARLQKQIQALNTTLASAAGQTDGDLRNLVQQRLTAAQKTLLSLRVIGFQVTPLTVAVPRPGPISPHPKKAGLLGFLVALIVVGESTVIARNLSDRFARTNDVAQITSFTGLPVLAVVPRGRGPDVVESFRTLRTNVMFLEGAGRPRTVAMVSPNPGAGKSFCAVQLAEAAVAVDAAVVLVDADLRRPVLHSRLRCDREPGLSDALRGGDLPSTLHSVDGIANLTLIPSGSAVDDTVAVLGGRAFRHVLDSLDLAELVVVDTPPGAVYADALAVAAQCDATLLVFDATSTRRRAARTMIDSLERTGSTLIGVVVNNAQVNLRDTYERGSKWLPQRR
jgi:capsular exopolysaccharide synthesis family protein